MGVSENKGVVVIGGEEEGSVDRDTTVIVDRGEKEVTEEGETSGEGEGDKRLLREYKVEFVTEDDAETWEESLGDDVDEREGAVEVLLRGDAVPMNVGEEVMDEIEFVDSPEGDCVEEECKDRDAAFDALSSTDALGDEDEVVDNDGLRVND